LLEARTWYANIRPELGDRFALTVLATVEAIAEHPLQFPAVYRDYRRAGVRRFPYGIFFEVQEHRIVVIACFHAGAIRGAGKHVSDARKEQPMFSTAPKA
jgi:plasmid stabilization system protein ParE